MASDDIVLVLGYEADLDVFIGYGLGGKQGPEPPIFETAVDVSLFHRALQDGLSFGKWTNRFFIGANVDIQIQVKGVDEFLKNLRDLGVNRIPNYVARALTGIADQAQDAMMGNARSMLTIRGNWLVKGYKYGINRKQAYKMRGRRVPETGQGSACDL